jgi:hypothetical protein
MITTTHFPPSYPLTRDQFYQRTNDEVAPCHRLMLAVMVEGLTAWQGGARCAHGPKRGRDRLAFEANEWIFGPLNRRDLFSFASICDVLGFDIDKLRKGLAEARDRGEKFGLIGIDPAEGRRRPRIHPNPYA